MSWTWEIRSGKLFEDSGALVAIGYSGGDKGQAPDGVNNPDCCHLSCVGPVPPGTYSILAPENDPTTGVFSMPLLPDPTNDMFGRSGFRIHGDNPQLNRSASEGCIILPRSIREQVWQSIDHSLKVVVSVPDDFPD